MNKRFDQALDLQYFADEMPSTTGSTDFGGEETGSVVDQIINNNVIDSQPKSLRIPIKVNGQDMGEKEFTTEEIQKYIQLGMSSDERFKQAKAVESEALQLKSRYERRLADVEKLLEETDDTRTTSTRTTKTGSDGADIKEIIRSVLSEEFGGVKTKVEDLEKTRTRQAVADEVKSLMNTHGLTNAEAIEVVKFCVDGRHPNLETAYRVMFFDKAKSMGSDELMKRLTAFSGKGGGTRPTSGVSAEEDFARRMLGDRLNR